MAASELELRVDDAMLDVMVQWDETTGDAASIARVRSVESPDSLDSPSRDVVTLYGAPTPESFALALAAAVEARRVTGGSGALSELRISASGGAVGDTARRDSRTGELIRQDLIIPLTVLRATAAELLAEGGQAIRRLLASLLMPDWPEGTRRVLTFQMACAGAGHGSEVLAAMREADALNFDDE